MAPRLSKRQQREQEELEALAALQTAHKAVVEPGSDSGDQIDPVEEPPKTSLSTGFAALTVNQDEEPVEESEEEEAEQPQQKKPQAKKSRRKKKPAATSATVTPSENTTTPKAGHSKGKGKGKAPAAPSEPSKASDDFDAILQQMSSKYPELKQAATVTLQSAAKREFWKLLSVEPTYLDGDEEMRRFFGSKVVDSAEVGSKKGGRGSRRTGHASSATMSRYHLVKPPDTWVHIMRSNQGGVAMEAIPEEELLGRKSTTFREEKWWTFTHSQSYKKAELRFLSAVAVGDPNAFAEILRESPWHIDTLLQLSEVFRQQEDYSHATELVERGVLAFERAFAPSFNITSGLHRLDFERIENRPFFLALHRQVLQLERRGCMRAAFEHARLLYSLNPSEDPHGALLHLDYLAPRCGMNDWLIRLWDTWENVDSEEPTGKGVPRLNPKFLPGMPYAKALAMWNLENQAGDKAHEKSTDALIEAILTFPSVVPVVADKAGILLSPEVRGLPSMRIEPGWIPSDPAASTVHLLSHLYAHRSVSIWKQPTHVEWMQKTISKIPLSQLGGGAKPTTMKPRSLLSGSLAFFAHGPTLDLFRHVIITENRSLIGFFSPSMVNHTTMHAYDPVPPASSVTNYDDEYFGQEMKRAFQREQQARARQMMQRVIQQHQAQGGVLGDMDDADLADPEIQRMLLQRIVAAHGEGAGPDFNPPMQAGGMPGGFEDDDELEDEDADEEGAEVEGQAGQGGGILQTLWDGLWGGPPVADDQDEED